LPRNRDKPPDLELDHKWPSSNIEWPDFKPEDFGLATPAKTEPVKQRPPWRRRAERLAAGDHEDSVRSASFSPDGARIVTASYDRTARIWDATTGQEITRIVLDASVTGLSVHGGTIALGDALGRIHVFESEEFLTGRGSASG
jgi:WD40 repeat protein